MQAFYANIAEITIKNKAYRRVLHTEKTFQLVLMSLLPNQDIGMETHPSTTQFIRVESGDGMAIIGDMNYPLKDDMIVVIPMNTQHNIINTGKKDMKLYTIYSGEVQHPPDLVEVTKPEA